MQRPGEPMPLPDWYVWRRIAERWRTDPDTVMRRPSYWVAREIVLMQAEDWVASQQGQG